ncbi:MAG: FAD-binding protein [Firmicutes bacterium]|nr:FAD-binding protein [Bacillota bacterium]
MSNAVVRELKSLLGSDQVLVSPADRIAYSYDATYISNLPDVVVFPRDTEQVRAVLHVARHHQIPVYPRGSGTGLSGGSVPLGGIAIVMTRMNRILEIDRSSLLARVQAGVLTAHLKEAVRAHGLFYPPDPGSGRISTIGGNIAENASGPRGFHYGGTGRYVLGLQVVLADGTVLETGGRTAKNVTGYDLTSLFVGSEGTLGIVTEATLKLLPPPPPARGTLVASFPDVHSLGRAIGELAAHPARPMSLEMVDAHCLAVLGDERPPEIPQDAQGAVLCEVLDWPEALAGRLEKLADVCRREGAIATVATADPETQHRVWAMREALSPAIARIKPTKISEDATVPIGSIPDFLADLEGIRKRWEINLLVFGHAGDGNLHPNIICDERDEDEMRRVRQAIDDIFAAALKRKGTLSGEHGIGLLKRPYMRSALPPATLEAMRRLKQFFDPDNLLNPGKIFPDPSGHPAPQPAQDTRSASKSGPGSEHDPGQLKTREGRPA